MESGTPSTPRVRGGSPTIGKIIEPNRGRPSARPRLRSPRVVTHASELGPLAVGIDISLWQPQVDWPALQRSGASFAFIKASEGVHITDPMFAQHWQGARSVGILRGAYHFFRPLDDPLVQAQHFCGIVGDGQSDLPPALDLEAETLDGETLVTAENMAANIERVRVWLAAVEDTLGLRPLIYTGMGFWQQVVDHLGGTWPPWLQDYPLWVACWIYRYYPGREPLRPVGWNSWAFWQFGSPDDPDSMLLRLDGIPGGSDINFFHGTEQELREWIRPPDRQTRFRGSNQDVINTFRRAFGKRYWIKLWQCGLHYVVARRRAPYTGPAVEDLPNLTEKDREALRRVLSAQPGD